MRIYTNDENLIRKLSKAIHKVNKISVKIPLRFICGIWKKFKIFLEKKIYKKSQDILE